MTTHLTRLAGFAALLTAGAAAAAIPDGNSGNGGLFLAAFDPTAKVSFVQDLHTTIDGFAPNTSRSWNLSASPQWNAFLGTVNPATGLGVSPDRLRWAVAALDNTGVGHDGPRYLSTSAESLTALAAQSNGALLYFQRANDYVAASNVLMGTGDAAIGLGPNNYAWFGDGMGERWRNRAVFDNSAGVGSAMGFFKLTPSSTDGLALASVSQFANSGGGATWKLLNNGLLSYTIAVQPVPEPDAGTLSLVGCLLVAAAGARRRRNAR